MKRSAVFMMVSMLTVLASAAMAGDKGEGKVGKLFLFQKCDPSLNTDDPKYDPNTGCPLPGNGPWPIIPDNRRWGQMKYNLLGNQFRFSFQGERLLPQTDYALIYYPDAWPGKGLICLGSNTTNPEGNVQIHGEMNIPTGLPAPYDANFNPVAPSGAVGAKIWLVLAADVDCVGSGEVDQLGLQADPTQMLAWNPAAYLFEGNLIAYQYSAEVSEDLDSDNPDSEDADADTAAPQTNGNGNNGNGKDGHH